jgi:hypothetical protein
MGESFTEAGRWGREPPDVILRAHRHRYCEVKMPSQKPGSKRIRNTICVTSPGWQLKTPFLWRLPSGRMAEPHVGGLCVRMGDDELHVREWHEPFDRPLPIELRENPDEVTL